MRLLWLHPPPSTNAFFYLFNYSLLQGSLTDENSKLGVSWNLVAHHYHPPMHSGNPPCPNDASFTPWRDLSQPCALSVSLKPQTLRFIQVYSCRQPLSSRLLSWGTAWTLSRERKADGLIIGPVVFSSLDIFRDKHFGFLYILFWAASKYKSWSIYLFRRSIHPRMSKIPILKEWN